jgi:hypothetical protein
MSQINVNNIRAKDGVGPVGFPGGINATGVVTATSFSGPLTGNVTGTADLASNLTGTPNITVGTVTGTDATFSGNLTVQGTTTTIDTAVTAVDSLAVDGNITALGRLGIGTDNTSGDVLTVSGVDAFIRVDRSNNNPGIDLRYQGSSTNRGVIDVTTTGDLRFATGGSTERLRIDQYGTTKFKGPMTEKCHYDTGGGLNGDYNHDLITYGNVYWSDTAAAGAWTFNLRGSATVALNDIMDTGESLSFWLAQACHSTTSHYMTAFKVDGTTISGGNIIWAGGSAPTSAGGGSGTKDVYTFTVFKVGNASFRAFAAVTNHT